MQVDGKLRDRVEVDADASGEGGPRGRPGERQGAGAPRRPRGGQGRGGPRPSDQPGDPEVRMSIRTKTKRSAVLGLGFFLLALSGCGYALVGRASNVPADIKEVYIRPLENRTQRSQVEQALTRAIAEEMVTRQRFAVVGSAERADGRALGRGGRLRRPAGDLRPHRPRHPVRDRRSSPRSPSSGLGSDEVIWSNDRYTFRESYEIAATERGVRRPRGRGHRRGRGALRGDDGQRPAGRLLGNPADTPEAAGSMRIRGRRCFRDGGFTDRWRRRAWPGGTCSARRRSAWMTLFWAILSITLRASRAGAACASAASPLATAARSFLIAVRRRER